MDGCRARYPSRKRAGKSTTIGYGSVISDWKRKGTLNVFNGGIDLGRKAKN